MRTDSLLSSQRCYPLNHHAGGIEFMHGCVGDAGPSIRSLHLQVAQVRCLGSTRPGLILVLQMAVTCPWVSDPASLNAFSCIQCVWKYPLLHLTHSVQMPTVITVSGQKLIIAYQLHQQYVLDRMLLFERGTFIIARHRCFCLLTVTLLTQFMCSSLKQSEPITVGTIIVSGEKIPNHL